MRYTYLQFSNIHRYCLFLKDFFEFIVTRFSKYKSILFRQIKHILTHQYIHTLKDLRVLFDSKLFFKSHIMAIKNNAMKPLGFIKQSCNFFHYSIALKTL